MSEGEIRILWFIAGGFVTAFILYLFRYGLAVEIVRNRRIDNRNKAIKNAEKQPASTEDTSNFPNNADQLIEYLNYTSTRYKAACDLIDKFPRNQEAMKAVMKANINNELFDAARKNWEKNKKDLESSKG